MNGCRNVSRQCSVPSRRVKSGSIADTAAGGPLDGVTVTILNPDKRIGTHMFATVARNDGDPALDRGHSGHSPIRCCGTSMSALVPTADVHPGKL
jgi:hypothetical protein